MLINQLFARNDEENQNVKFRDKILAIVFHLETFDIIPRSLFLLRLHFLSLSLPIIHKFMSSTKLHLITFHKLHLVSYPHVIHDYKLCHLQFTITAAPHAEKKTKHKQTNKND